MPASVFKLTTGRTWRHPTEAWAARYHAGFEPALAFLEKSRAVQHAEKQRLEAKLSSIKELKLAIHDLRYKMWNDRWAAWRAQVQNQRAEDEEALARGNRGYLLRDGVSTLARENLRLRVHVLEPQAK